MSENDAYSGLDEIKALGFQKDEDYVVGVYDFPFDVPPERPAPWVELRQNEDCVLFAHYISL